MRVIMMSELCAKQTSKEYHSSTIRVDARDVSEGASRSRKLLEEDANF